MNDLASITLRMLFEHPLDIPLMQWGLFVLIVGFVSALVYIQMCKDHIDLRWLILERSNKPSAVKIAQLTALIVSTWGFVVLTLKGQLSEGYFVGYMVCWSGSAAVEAYYNKGSRDTRRADDAPPDEGNQNGKP